MKRQITLLVVAATFACCSVAKANITNAWWHADGDGAIICNAGTTWNGSSSTLTLVGDQYGLPGQPGPGVPAHMIGAIQTDTIADPTLYLDSSVDNDTGGMWIGYQVNVVMSVPFTFVTSVDMGIPGVSDPTSTWYIANTPTVGPGVGIYAGEYEGTIDYSGGTPLGIGQELDFNYAIHFASSTDYSFTQEMIPMFSEVPEPTTLALAGMGGLILALRLRRSSRTNA